MAGTQGSSHEERQRRRCASWLFVKASGVREDWSRLQSLWPLLSYELAKGLLSSVAASEIVLYYAALTLLSLFLVMRHRPRKGMLLRLRGKDRGQGRVRGESDSQSPIIPSPENFSHIQPVGERPLNVVFNYNGHSWDAYEVLG